MSAEGGGVAVRPAAAGGAVGARLAAHRALGYQEVERIICLRKDL